MSRIRAVLADLNQLITLFAAAKLEIMEITTRHILCVIFGAKKSPT